MLACAAPTQCLPSPQHACRPSRQHSIPGLLLCLSPLASTRLHPRSCLAHMRTYSMLDAPPPLPRVSHPGFTPPFIPFEPRPPPGHLHRAGGGPPQCPPPCFQPSALMAVYCVPDTWLTPVSPPLLPTLCPDGCPYTHAHLQRARCAAHPGAGATDRHEHADLVGARLQHQLRRARRRPLRQALLPEVLARLAKRRSVRAWKLDLCTVGRGSIGAVKMRARAGRSAARAPHPGA
eukprot:312713-Chlamydomonas_euryale.AAC.1